MNATKYGFFSKIITEYDKLEHSDFCKEIYACFMPETEYEKQLVEILLSNFLTYRRICFVEREYIQTKLDPDIDIGIKICSHEGYQPTMKLDLLDDLNKFQKYKTNVYLNLSFSYNVPQPMDNWANAVMDPARRAHFVIFLCTLP